MTRSAIEYEGRFDVENGVTQNSGYSQYDNRNFQLTDHLITPIIAIPTPTIHISCIKYPWLPSWHLASPFLLLV